MKNGVRTYHIVVSSVITFVSITILILYGYLLGNIVNEGIYSKMHLKYNVTKAQFLIYISIIISISLLVIINQIVFLIRRKRDRLKFTYLSYLVFIIFIVIGGLYMNIR